MVDEDDGLEKQGVSSKAADPARKGRKLTTALRPWVRTPIEIEAVVMFCERSLSCAARDGQTGRTHLLLETAPGVIETVYPRTDPEKHACGATARQLVLN